MPLTYWYNIKDTSGKVKEDVDIRKLNAFIQCCDGKKPSHFQIICHRAEIIPEIIKLSINNHELQF